MRLAIFHSGLDFGSGTNQAEYDKECRLLSVDSLSVIKSTTPGLASFGKQFIVFAFENEESAGLPGVVFIYQWDYKNALVIHYPGLLEN